MTIKVTVRNEDSRNSSLISVETVANEMCPSISNTPILELGARQDADFYVHSEQHLVIKEVSQ